MKTIFRMMALFVLCFGLQGCSDDDSDNVASSLEVTPANIAGTWMLAEWNGGEELPEGLYCYIVFDRRERTYKMYQNFDSMYARCITGEYFIEDDVYKGSIISGTYDFRLFDNEWNHSYIVTNLTLTGSMIWTAEDDSENICRYIRCDEVPEVILSECSL